MTYVLQKRKTYIHW